MERIVVIWLLFIWLAGWFITCCLIFLVNRKEIDVPQAMTRFLVSFYLWPFYLGCYVYSLFRSEQ